LIDEVDKAPRDLPNDILNEIDHMYFRVPELDNRQFSAPEDMRPIVIITSNSEKSLPDAFQPLLPFLVVMFVGCVWIAYSAWCRSARQVCAATCVTWALTVIVATVWLVPFIDRFKSPRPVAIEIARRLASTTPLFIYADTMNDYNFYTVREIIPVIPPGVDLAKLRAKNSSGYLLIKAKDLLNVGSTIRNAIEIDHRAAGRAWYLVPLNQIAP
jgi:hypothetical protein